MSDRKFKFRGFDNPSTGGKEVFYGEGNFTVSHIYGATSIQPGHTKNEKTGPDARFSDNNNVNYFEELRFFDEVFD